MTVIFLSDADEEFREAAQYYENESPGLGLIFIAAVHQTISWNKENPKATTSVDGSVRRKTLGRFPYSVIYAVDDDGLIIVAVAHQKRRPRYWKKRLKEF